MWLISSELVSSVKFIWYTSPALVTPFQISSYPNSTSIKQIYTLMIYNIYIPCSSRSFSNIEEWPVIFAIDRLVDLVFTLDVILNFRMASLNEDGQVWNVL